MLAIDGKLYCPRRREQGIEPGQPTPFKVPDHDEWKQGSRGHLVCSWCGSSHPDHVFAAIRDGLELEPTDKNYKLYIPGGKFYFQHFNDDERTRFIDALNARQVKLAHPGHFYVLPYFIGRK